MRLWHPNPKWYSRYSLVEIVALIVGILAISLTLGFMYQSWKNNVCRDSQNPESISHRPTLNA
jgi:hypothetical protein